MTKDPGDQVMLHVTWEYKNGGGQWQAVISVPLQGWWPLTSSQLFTCENEGSVLPDHLIFREELGILFLNVGSV